MTTVGLCIIVRDAEETIGALLESIDGAFDEVVVVDTGSVDRTREIVAAHFGVPAGSRAEWEAPEAAPIVLSHFGRDPDIHTRLVLARFRWVDDFAAARNFAFSLGTATWRGYLDADDTLPGAQRLKPTILDTEKTSPTSNVVVLPYDYANGELVQDKFRFMRWADGWTWVNEIHEEIVRSPPGPRVHSRYYDLVVKHRYTAVQTAVSLTRNKRICQAARQRAIEAGDSVKAATMSYYLGLYETLPGGNAAEAEASLSVAAFNLGDSAVAQDARYHLARFLLTRNDLDGALHWASVGAGRNPEHPEALAILATVQSERGDHAHAVAAWDRFRTTPPPIFSTSRDVVLCDGLMPCAIAKSYLALGQAQKAFEVLSTITVEVSRMDRVTPAYRTAMRAVMKGLGVERVRALVEFMLWDTEPIKARRLLRDFVPAGVADSTEIAVLLRSLDAKVPHLKSWEGYQATYATIPGETYHTSAALADGVRRLGRCRAVVEWAKAAASTIDSIAVLSVGFQDGIIEREVLHANDAIKLTVADVAPQASEGLARLQAEFPGRVTSHAIVADHYDWAGYSETFDAIFFFEVLEHVPSDGDALAKLHRHLKPAGTLFLSTPVADMWIEPYLTGPNGPTWYGHVRAHNPTSLWRLLHRQGLTGRLEATDGGGVFLARVRRYTTAQFTGKAKRVSIYVPGAPLPFDPDSMKHGHVGGSEEAVIHLSKTLAARGVEVTVYAPRPQRSDGITVHGNEGVLWRDVADFDAGGDHGAVLLWRCPTLLADGMPLAGPAPYRKILWLHDAAYGKAAAMGYKNADAVVVLSDFHQKILAASDGATDAIAWARATNGIDLADYPELLEDDPRDPFHVVYGSSPDRGLDQLLLAWPFVKAAEPRARLTVTYTWALLEAAMQRDAGLANRFGGLRVKAESMGALGVESLGGVDHAALAKLYRSAGVWAYPAAGRFDCEISCAHGDTLVSIPGDHRGGPPRVRIADLAGKSGFPVYAYDAKEHRFRIATANAVWQTKIADELVAITLDDGSVLKLTPDHRVLNFDGEWVDAGTLLPGSRLMALHHRYNVMIKDADGGWESESRLVGEWAMGRKILGSEHVDHADPFRLDNRPGQLAILTAGEHASKTHTGKVRSKASDRHRIAAFKQWANSPRGQKELSVRHAKNGRSLWERINALPPEERAAWLAQRAAKKIATELAKKAADPAYAAAYLARCRETGKMGAEARWNHKVVKVERIAGAPVFDMEVEGFHNFVAEGVVIHNCITAMKTQAAGCWPVVAGGGALEETLNGRMLPKPIDLHLDTPLGAEWFATAILDVMHDAPPFLVRKAMSDAARLRFGWGKVADRFIEIIGGE